VSWARWRRDSPQNLNGSLRRDRPKHFCSMVGKDTLLEQTRKRANGLSLGTRSFFCLPGVLRLHHDEHRWPVETSCAAAKQARPRRRCTGFEPPKSANKEPAVRSCRCDHHYSEIFLVWLIVFSFFFFGKRLRVYGIAFDIAAGAAAVGSLLGAASAGPKGEYGWIRVGATAGRRR